MQTLTHQTRYFDGFTLDLTRGCLRRGAQEIKLPPKPFAALKYLVENPGRLISNAELIEVIWPDTAVTDDSLVQCVIEVRRALSDDAQQVIKTVPRRGYIFDKPVTTGRPKRCRRGRLMRTSRACFREECGTRCRWTAPRC